MGYNTAVDLADAEISLEMGITYQLRNNHYPPVPTEMIDVCVRAVELCRQGITKCDITIKSPFKHRQYGWFVPAWVFVDAYHLEPWVES